MKYEIRNRWTRAVICTTEIECDESDGLGFRTGLAVRWARRNGANLSDVDLRGADLSDAYLSGADLRGADLRGANLLGANLSDVDLRGADLSGANLRGANLRGADLRGADLRRSNLRGADLSGADLRGADLRRSNLRGVPKIDNIHQLVFAAASQPAALDMDSWHTCTTTHCRAGWVVTLAGEAGKDLETYVGTSAAASLIYLASDPDLERVPDFYGDNASTLEDMKARAEAEALKSV